MNCSQVTRLWSKTERAERATDEIRALAAKNRTNTENRVLKGSQSRIRMTRLLIIIGPAAVAVLCVVLIQRLKMKYELPDGTVLHLDRAVKGRQGTFVLGNPVQKILWRLSDNAKYQ